MKDIYFSFGRGAGGALVLGRACVVLYFLFVLLIFDSVGGGGGYYRNFKVHGSPALPLPQ